MSRRQSSAVDAALALIGQPKEGGGVWSARAAALAQVPPLAMSTIYRALARQRQEASPDAKWGPKKGDPSV